MLRRLSWLAGLCSLSLLGDVNANMEDIIEQTTAFMCCCYNMNGATITTETTWTTKTGRKTATKVPKLCSLPPTSEVFEENVKEPTYVQCTIWRKALQEPPNVNPT